MRVINLFAGPGAGKSTTAAGLFYRLKMLGHNVELITEFAKELTWQDRQRTLEDQIYVFASQLHRQNVLKNKVDAVITDSPLLLSLIYGDNLPHSFKNLVVDCWYGFDNINFMLHRCTPYTPVGRNQTEAEAVELDKKIHRMLWTRQIRYEEVTGDETAIDKIMERIT